MKNNPTALTPSRASSDNHKKKVLYEITLYILYDSKTVSCSLPYAILTNPLMLCTVGLIVILADSPIWSSMLN